MAPDKAGRPHPPVVTGRVGPNQITDRKVSHAGRHPQYRADQITADNVRRGQCRLKRPTTNKGIDVVDRHGLHPDQYLIGP